LLSLPHAVSAAIAVTEAVATSNLPKLVTDFLLPLWFPIRCRNLCGGSGRIADGG
jgi:hypothetical protein